MCQEKEQVIPNKNISLIYKKSIHNFSNNAFLKISLFTFFNFVKPLKINICKFIFFSFTSHPFNYSFFVFAYK